MPLPISVVVPHLTRRRAFLGSKVLPAILQNDPAEIIVESGDHGACEKRNAGARKAAQPHLFFCDDDCVLLPGCLRALYAALDGDPGAAFAYSDDVHIVYTGTTPVQYALRRAGPWDPARLRRESYVDTAALVRRHDFCGFDPAIRRFQDWDLWLTMAFLGYRGVYVAKALVEKHRFDRGISDTVPAAEAASAIRAKHFPS